MCFFPDKRRLEITPLGENIIFRKKEELDWFIEKLTAQSQAWYKDAEPHPEEEASVFYIDPSRELVRERLRRGLLFGKRRRR